jgi:hypothetical protein
VIEPALAGNGRGCGTAGGNGIAVNSGAGVLKVSNDSQQLFNRGDREGGGAEVGGIECQIGGPDRNQTFHVRLKPDDTAAA